MIDCLGLSVDRQGEEIDERKINADQDSIWGYRNCLMGDGGPKENKSPGLDPLLSSIEKIGHLPFKKQIDLDVIVPVGRAHCTGDMALNQELAP